MANRKKGFTLVELLIVIVVIGVLSAMMMLSSTEAVSSAKANNIIVKLKNLKTAATEYYMDNIDYFSDVLSGKYGGNKQDFFKSDEGNASKKIVKKDIFKYINDENGDNLDHYQFTANSYDGGVEWFIKVTKDAKDLKDKHVQEKLANRAKSFGLLSNTYARNSEGGRGLLYEAGKNTDMYYLIMFVK